MELTLADFVLFVLLGSFALVPVLAVISRILHARVEKRALANRVDLPAVPACVRGHQPRENRPLPDLRRGQ